MKVLFIFLAIYLFVRYFIPSLLRMLFLNTFNSHNKKSNSDNSEFDFFIYDSKGLLVKKGRIYNPNSINNIRLELPSGIYSMMIRSKNNILTKKISVK